MLMRKKNLASVDLDFESHNEKQLIKEKTTHNFNPPQKINGTQLHTHYLETPFIAKVNALFYPPMLLMPLHGAYFPSLDLVITLIIYI